MKYIGCLISLSVLFLSKEVVAQSRSVTDSFRITGRFFGSYKGYIYLKYFDYKNEYVKDSCLLQNGRFQFTGRVNVYTDNASLKLNPQFDEWDKAIAVKIALENRPLQVAVTYNQFEKITVTGLRSTAEWRQLKIIRKKVDANIDRCEKAIEAADSLATIPLEKKLEKHERQQYRLDMNWCRKNPSANIAPQRIYYWWPELSPIELKRQYKHLTNLQQNSYYGLKIKKEINRQDSAVNMIGYIAPRFFTTDINDLPFRLDSIWQNSYVLLDFWASWCAPCRAETPLLKKWHQLYAAKGLQIVGVADNVQEEDRWKKAVLQDGTGIWWHILRTANRQKIQDNTTDISNMYMVDLLPTKILIAPGGIIIGRYTTTDSHLLAAKLKQIFE